MAESCSQEINGLPILSGCPGDSELFLVMGSNASGNKGGYGLRYAKDVRTCWLHDNIEFVFNNFTIGQPGSLMNAGDFGFTVTVPNILQDSVFITFGGPELPRGDATQVSYQVTYASDSSSFVVTFNQAASDGDWYILHFAYTT